MEWNPNQEQEPHIQGQYGRYESQEGGREYSSQQQEYQPTHNQQQYVHPAPPLDYASFAAILSYALGWFSGLLFLIFERENRYVRFHALQSLIFFGSINVFDIVFTTFLRMGGRHEHLPFMFLPFLFFLLLNFLAFICWIVAMIHASRGTYFQLPFVGRLVAKYVNHDGTLK